MSTALGVFSVPINNTCSGQLLVKAPIHVVKSLSSLAEESCTYMESSCGAMSQSGTLGKTASCAKATFGCMGSCGARLLQVVCALPTIVVVPFGWLCSVVEYGLCCCKRSPCVTKPSVCTTSNSQAAVQVQQPIIPQTTIIQIQQQAASINTRASSVTVPSSVVLPIVNPENLQESSSSSASSKTLRSSTIQTAQMQQLAIIQAMHSQSTSQLSAPVNTRAASFTLPFSDVLPIVNSENLQESFSVNANSKKTLRSPTMQTAQKQQLVSVQATHSQPTSQPSATMNTRVSLTLSSSIILEIANSENPQESSSSSTSNETAQSSTMRTAKLGTADLQEQEAFQRKVSAQDDGQVIPLFAVVQPIRRENPALQQASKPVSQKASDKAVSSSNESDNPLEHQRFDKPRHRPPDLLAEQRKAQKKNKLKVPDGKARNRKDQNDNKPKHRHVCSRTEPINSARYTAHLVNRFQKKEQDLAAKISSEMSNVSSPNIYRSQPVLPSHNPVASAQTLSAIKERDHYVASRLVQKYVSQNQPS